MEEEEEEGEETELRVTYERVKSRCSGGRMLRLRPLITLRRTTFPSSELRWNRRLVARPALFVHSDTDTGPLINRARSSRSRFTSDSSTPRPDRQRSVATINV